MPRNFLPSTYHPRPRNNHYSLDILGARVHIPGHARNEVDDDAPSSALAENEGLLEYESGNDETRWMTKAYYHSDDDAVRKRQAWLSKGAEAERLKALRKQQQTTFDLHKRMYWLRGTIEACEKQWQERDAAMEEETPPRSLVLKYNWENSALWYVDCGSSGSADRFHPKVDTVHLSFEFKDVCHPEKYSCKLKAQQDAIWDRFIALRGDANRSYYAIEVRWLATFNDIRSNCYVTYMKNDGDDRDKRKHYWQHIDDLAHDTEERQKHGNRLLGANKAFTLLNSIQGRYLAYFLYKSASRAGLEGGSSAERWLWPHIQYSESYFLKKIDALVTSSEKNPGHRLMDANERLPAVALHTEADFDTLADLQLPNGRNWAISDKKMLPTNPKYRNNLKRGAVGLKTGAVGGYQFLKKAGQVLLKRKVKPTGTSS